MRRTALLVLASTLVAPFASQAVETRPAPSPAVELERILAEVHAHEIEANPALSILEGRPVERLPDLSRAAAAKEAEFSRAIVARLDALDPKRLDAEERTSWAVLRWQAERSAEAADHADLLFQVSPYTFSFLGTAQIFAAARFETPADLDRYLALARQLPATFDTLRTNLAGQKAKGIVPPLPALDPILAIFRALDRPAAESPYAIAPARLEKIAPERAASFQTALREILEGEVRPAVARLIAYLDLDLRRAAPATVGLGQYPGGPAAYRSLIRLHTTLDLSPEEIHARGLSEVARIESEMARLRAKIAFSGTAAEFHAKLKTDPRFLAKTPEEVGARLLAPISKIEPLIPRFFAAAPRAPYGVERLDPALEGSLTFGYYREPTRDRPTGAYLYNGSKLDQRPLANAAALIYHELVPGHHFQIAMQRENMKLPEFRRNGGATAMPAAFVEGWAEYASDLAGEMGLYADPYDAYGRLGMDIFLAVRLVVDTGMNALGWSRERASAYMKEHTLESDTQIATETLRYATDLPAQALAYKTGALFLRDLRARAERDLGPRFDLREFHRVVLEGGAMPLPILEDRVAAWIAARKSEP